MGDTDAAPCGQCDACGPGQLTLPRDAAAEADVAGWLGAQNVPIAPYRPQRLDAGAALLDGKLRAPLFVAFMRGRLQPPTASLADSGGLPPELWRQYEGLVERLGEAA